MSDDVEALIVAFQAGLKDKPERALGLIGLAELVAKKDHKPRAAQIAREALAAARGDPRIVARARALLHGLLPGYHVPMMNDARRNAAWDAALRKAIRPGMQVFEIGTGAGMLAMMAARAGAGHVTTCETDPVAAQLARELVRHNGYADRVTVLTRRSQDVRIGPDMARPADLLFCDIFGDDLFTFDPFAAIADAKARLLVPGAVLVPAAVSLRVALAHWRGYARAGRLDAAAGFDLAPMRDFATARKSLTIGDAGLDLLSEPRDLLRRDLSRPLAAEGTSETTCEASRDGEANGLARWIKLDLDGETALEARPEPGAVFFSNLIVLPLPQPRALHKGERLTVRAAYSRRKIETWLA
jgi:predicted O-methyltransferase YrrM